VKDKIGLNDVADFLEQHCVQTVHTTHSTHSLHSLYSTLRCIYLECPEKMLHLNNGI